MEIDRELIALVLGWGASITSWLALSIVMMSLFDSQDPGDALLHDGEKLLTFDFMLRVPLYLSIIWLFGFGFSSMFWMIPEFAETDEGEDTPRLFATLLFGTYASAVMFKVAQKINRLHWARVGKDEIIADVTKLLPELLYKNADAVQKIDMLIEEIEVDGERKSYVVEIAAQRRVKFLKRLKGMV